MRLALLCLTTNTRHTIGESILAQLGFTWYLEYKSFLLAAHFAQGSKHYYQKVCRSTNYQGANIFSIAEQPGNVLWQTDFGLPLYPPHLLCPNKCIFQSKNNVVFPSCWAWWPHFSQPQNQILFYPLKRYSCCRFFLVLSQCTSSLVLVNDWSPWNCKNVHRWYFLCMWNIIYDME